MSFRNRNGSRHPAQKWRDRRKTIYSADVDEATAVIYGPLDGSETTHELLWALTSPDTQTRLKAFDSLRHIPKSTLAQQWEESRRVWPTGSKVFDCLERLEIEPPEIDCDRAIVTIISEGYETLLRSMLDTLNRFGQTPEAKVIVFCVGKAFDNISDIENITRIRCTAIERITPAIKGALYSAARLIGARSFIMLEADMLIVHSLQPLWTLIENARPGALIGCRAQLFSEQFTLREVLAQENAPCTDLEFLTNRVGFDSLFWFNGGLLAGRQEAFEKLEARFLEMMPFVSMWIEGAFEKAYADEFACNLAAGMMESRIELSGGWNVQFYNQARDHWCQTEHTPSGLKFSRLGETAKILHFLAPNRNLLNEVLEEINSVGIAPEGAT